MTFTFSRQITLFYKPFIEFTTILLANLILQAIYIIYRIYDPLSSEPLIAPIFTSQ